MATSTTIEERIIVPERTEYTLNNGQEHVTINNTVNLKQETDPLGKQVNEAGAKMDAGKAPVLRGLLHYFPKALTQVSMVSQAGHNKGYPWRGWESVPEGIVRYGDAMMRHLIAEETEGPVDTNDTNMLHAAQVAWNSLARLELILREQEKK